MFLTSCMEEDSRAKFLPIDIKELSYKKGDCVSFQIDSLNYGVGIVVDYSKDEGGLWYGLCFTDYYDTVQADLLKIKDKKIFGRKVESTLDENGFYTGLDIEFVNDSCLKFNESKITTIGNLTLNTKKIKYGSEGATNDYSEMLYTFKYGLEKRILPPDDYREHRTKLNDHRPEEYFTLTDFIIDKD